MQSQDDREPFSAEHRRERYPFSAEHFGIQLIHVAHTFVKFKVNGRMCVRAGLRAITCEFRSQFPSTRDRQDFLAIPTVNISPLLVKSTSAVGPPARSAPGNQLIAQ